MIELCYKYFYVQFIWLYVLTMSRTSFRVSPHCIVTRMSKNYLFKTGSKSIECMSFSSCSTFRMNPHSIVALRSKNSYLKTYGKSEFWVDWNWTQTQKHFIRKRTLNHLAESDKWLSCILGTYLYGTFEYIFLSYHKHVQPESTLEIIKCLK